jgi:hypothetical protein
MLSFPPLLRLAIGQYRLRSARIGHKNELKRVKFAAHYLRLQLDRDYKARGASTKCVQKGNGSSRRHPRQPPAIIRHLLELSATEIMASRLCKRA